MGFNSGFKGLKCLKDIRVCEFPFCCPVRLSVCIAVHLLTILRNHTECWGVVLCPRIQVSGRRWAVSERIFVVFLLPVIVRHVRPRFLPSVFFSVNYSMIILSFRALWSVIMIAPLSPLFIWQLSFITSRRYSAARVGHHLSGLC